MIFLCTLWVSKSDVVNVIQLSEYERQKASLEGEKADLEVRISGLTAIITDIGNL